jgi:hypothetical protein
LRLLDIVQVENRSVVFIFRVESVEKSGLWTTGDEELDGQISRMAK